MRRWIKPMLTGSILFLVAIAALIAWFQFPWLSSPTYGLRLAVGPTFSDDGQKFYAAFVRDMAEEYPWVRLRPVPAESWNAAGQALFDSSTDLAVLRSDDPAAGRGRTLIIFRRILAAFIADAKAGIESPRELSGKKVGILDGAQDERLIKTIIEFYGFQSGNIVAVAAADAGKAIREKRVAALLIVGPIGAGPVSDAISAVKKATKAEPALLDIDEAETFAKRYPVYETIEIPKGAFGAAPPQPEDKVNAVAVSVRLVSRASLANRGAGEITRIILATKAKLAASMPAVGQIEAPSTEEVGALAVHPGTLTYLKGEQQSLLQILSDQSYTILLLAGVVVSAVGWMFSRFRRRKPGERQVALARLSELRRQACRDPAQSCDIARELDDISGTLFDRMIAGDLGANQFLAASTIIDQLRAAARRQSAPAAQSLDSIQPLAERSSLKAS
jgi:hypothetical protein